MIRVRPPNDLPRARIDDGLHNHCAENVDGSLKLVRGSGECSGSGDHLTVAVNHVVDRPLGTAFFYWTQVESAEG